MHAKFILLLTILISSVSWGGTNQISIAHIRLVKSGQVVLPNKKTSSKFVYPVVSKKINSHSEEILSEDSPVITSGGIASITLFNNPLSSNRVFSTPKTYKTELNYVRLIDGNFLLNDILDKKLPGWEAISK